MDSLFRDTAAGFFIRFVSRNRLLKYPEELPGFEVPYAVEEETTSSAEKLSSPSPVAASPEDKLEGDFSGTPSASLVPSNSEDVESGGQDTELQSTLSRVIHPVVTKDGIILVNWYSEGSCLSF